MKKYTYYSQNAQGAVAEMLTVFAPVAPTAEMARQAYHQLMAQQKLIGLPALVFVSVTDLEELEPAPSLVGAEVN